MNKKVENNSSESCSIDNAKLDLMRMRFRIVVGEGVQPHQYRLAKKNVSNSVRACEQKKRKK